MFSRIAEKIIRQAMEEGIFENLEGKGRPLDLEENDNTPKEWQMAFTILKNANMSPRWIELDKEIRTELEEARQELLVAVKASKGEAKRRERAVQRFKDRLNELNEFLKELNLIVPGVILQRAALNADEEIEQIESAIEPDDEETF